MGRRANDNRRLSEFEAARRGLKQLGLVLTRRDGEYRVNFKGGREETAYYTNDLLDAFGTGRAMWSESQR